MNAEEERKKAVIFEVLGWVQRPFTIIVMLWIQSAIGGSVEDGSLEAYILCVPMFLNLFGICSLPLIVFWIPSFVLGPIGLFGMPILACLSVKAQIENWRTLARLSQ